MHVQYRCDQLAQHRAHPAAGASTWEGGRRGDATERFVLYLKDTP